MSWKAMPRLAVAVEGGFHLLAALGDDRGDPAGGREQSGGLGLDDLQIMVLAGLDPALGGELVDLPLGDDRGGPGEDLEDPERSVLDHQLEASREEEVADQDAGRIAPDDVGGAAAAPQAREI